MAPIDARERESITRVAAELDRLPNPFDRDADPVHLTGSVLVTGSRGVVLHRHKRLGLWLQPGGHLDPGEEPAEAALREAREETGLECGWTPFGRRLLHVDVHPAAHGHTHLDLRYVAAAEGEPAPPPNESQLVRWFSWEDAVAIADPGLAGALRKVMTGYQPAR
ncbi:MAG: NUDIX domain-containing protein [Chloroflexota bacterium]